MMERLCVFCGSAMGVRPEYADAARAVGQQLGQRGMQLVYGGGSIGLMGVVADAALAANVPVIGVIPKRLAKKEITHAGLADLRVVASMHERKAVMADLADGFLALPGGLGTLDELFEILTWAQLGEHQKPVGLLNVAGYFDPMLTFVERMIEEGFVKEKHRGLLLIDTEVETLIDRMAKHQPPQTTKWIDQTST